MLALSVLIGPLLAGIRTVSHAVSVFCQGIAQIARTEVFWTAMSALGTVAALYFIFRQIRISSNLSAYEFLRREDDRFQSAPLLRARASLACELLRRPLDYERLDEVAEDVLSYFEDLGLMLRKRIAPVDVLWTMQAWYILRYWQALEPYIIWLREADSDSQLYDQFERLAKTVRKYEEGSRGAALVLEADELITFLEGEAGLRVRAGVCSDVPSVAEVEANSYPKPDVRGTEQFYSSLANEGCVFLVAEVEERLVGFLLATVGASGAEIRSFAVAPQYRRMHIAVRLFERACDSCSQYGSTISARVRPNNGCGIALLKYLGFAVLTGALTARASSPEADWLRLVRAPTNDRATEHDKGERGAGASSSATA